MGDVSLAVTNFGIQPDTRADATAPVRFTHAQSCGFDAFFSRDAVDFVHQRTLTVYGTSTVTDNVREPY